LFNSSSWSLSRAELNAGRGTDDFVSDIGAKLCFEVDVFFSLEDESPRLFGTFANSLGPKLLGTKFLGCPTRFKAIRVVLGGSRGFGIVVINSAALRARHFARISF
jgi:hypothetical protein